MYDTATKSRNYQRRVAVAAGLGTTVEWYDFFIYGTSAALVFPELFFPSFSHTAGILASLASFGAAFVARPLGGVVFGHFGDKIGRKPMLVLTMFTMGIGTFLIGVVPTYAQIGAAAPIILVVLRLVQGFAVGGEWGGAVGLVSESAESQRRGLLTSFVQVGSPVAVVLSTAVVLWVHQLPEDDLLSWGWRIPFLSSVALVAVAVFVRLRVDESPEFKETKSEGVVRAPLLTVLQSYPRNTILGILVCTAVNVSGYIAVSYSLVHGEENGLTETETLFALLVGAAVVVCAVPLYGALADRIGYRPVFVFGAVVLVIWAVPFFALAGQGRLGSFIIAVVVLYALAHAPSYATQAHFFSDMFGTRARYSGMSISYQFGGLLSSAPTPFLAAFLVSSFDSLVPVVMFLVISGLVTIVSTIYIRPIHSEARDV